MTHEENEKKILNSRNPGHVESVWLWPPHDVFPEKVKLTVTDFHALVHRLLDCRNRMQRAINAWNDGVTSKVPRGPLDTLRIVADSGSVLIEADIRWPELCEPYLLILQRIRSELTGRTQSSDFSTCLFVALKILGHDILELTTFLGLTKAQIEHRIGVFFTATRAREDNTRRESTNRPTETVEFASSTQGSDWSDWCSYFSEFTGERISIAPSYPIQRQQLDIFAFGLLRKLDALKTLGELIATKHTPPGKVGLIRIGEHIGHMKNILVRDKALSDVARKDYLARYAFQEKLQALSTNLSPILADIAFDMAELETDRQVCHRRSITQSSLDRYRSELKKALGISGKNSIREVLVYVFKSVRHLR